MPLVPASVIGKHRIFVVDTCASKDVLSMDVAVDLCKEFIRPTNEQIRFTIASKYEYMSSGMRIQIAGWDVLSDCVLIDNAPNLMTVGSRTMRAGMSFISVRRRFPAFIPEHMKYIVILDLDGVIPIYNQNLECSGGRGLGALDLSLNAFKESCGIEINHEGKIQLDLPPVLSQPWQRRQDVKTADGPALVTKLVEDPPKSDRMVAVVADMHDNTPAATRSVAEGRV